tara:strand:- start:81 stop:503 length:423 start_codon:yes stop_codon:yes gene_type:complete
MFIETAVKKEVRMTVTTPIIKIFFLPNKSAQRPKMSTNIALAIKYAIGIQVMVTALSEKYSVMAGRATFVADNIIGVANALRTTIKRTRDCFEAIALLKDIIVTAKYRSLVISHFPTPNQNDEISHRFNHVKSSLFFLNI